MPCLVVLSNTHSVLAAVFPCSVLRTFFSFSDSSSLSRFSFSFLVFPLLFSCLAFSCSRSGLYSCCLMFVVATQKHRSTETQKHRNTETQTRRHAESEGDLFTAFERDVVHFLVLLDKMHGHPFFYVIFELIKILFVGFRKNDLGNHTTPCRYCLLFDASDR